MSHDDLIEVRFETNSLEGYQRSNDAPAGAVLARVLCHWALTDTVR